MVSGGPFRWAFTMKDGALARFQVERLNLRLGLSEGQHSKGGGTMLPFEIKHLDHIVLRVQDMQASLHFYSQMLGCQIKKRRDDLGMIHLGAGASMIDLVDA